MDKKLSTKPTGQFVHCPLSVEATSPILFYFEFREYIPKIM